MKLIAKRFLEFSNKSCLTFLLIYLFQKRNVRLSLTMLANVFSSVVFGVFLMFDCADESCINNHNHT